MFGEVLIRHCSEPSGGYILLEETVHKLAIMAKCIKSMQIGAGRQLVAVPSSLLDHFLVSWPYCHLVFQFFLSSLIKDAVHEGIGLLNLPALDFIL